jgi:hypothetical protein
MVGLMAGAIAIGGFIGHAQPSLSGKSDLELRRATTIGGLGGLGIGVLLIALPVISG